MDIKQILESLDQLNQLAEATKETPTGKVHKAEPGGYGRKFDTDEEGDENKKDKKKKVEPAEKRGRGRPPKEGGESDKKSKDIDQATKSLQSFMVGNLPKGKLPGKATTKHTLKDWIEIVKENQDISVEPLKQQSSVVKKNGEIVAQVDDPNLARQIQQGLSSGKMSLPNEQGVAEGFSDVVKGIKRSIKGKEHPDVVASKHAGKAMGHYNQGDIESGDKETKRYVKTRDMHLKAKGVAEGAINEFAPTDDGNNKNYEYEVYQCNPNDQFDWIGGPIYKTDDMGEAHSVAYNLHKKHPNKAFMIWQERSQGSRGGYGIKDDEQGVAEAKSLPSMSDIDQQFSDLERKINDLESQGEDVGKDHPLSKKWQQLVAMKQRAVKRKTKQGVTEGSGPKEKQKTPYRDINSPEYRKAADKQKQQMAKDAAAEPGKKLADKIAKKGVAEGLLAQSDEFKIELDDDGFVHLLDGENTVRVSMPVDIWKRMAGKKGRVDEFSVEVDDGQVHILDGEGNIRVSMPVNIWKQLGKQGVAEVASYKPSGRVKSQEIYDKKGNKLGGIIIDYDRDPDNWEAFTITKTGQLGKRQKFQDPSEATKWVRANSVMTIKNPVKEEADVAEGLSKQSRAKKEAESIKAVIARLEQELKDPNPHIDKDDIRLRLETEKRRLELYRDVLDEQGVAEADMPTDQGDVGAGLGAGRSQTTLENTNSSIFKGTQLAESTRK